MDASIEIISDVFNHTNADRLDIVKILGYQCITEKGLYKTGDKIVYIRPDALLPEETWAIEYRKYSPNRIKAVKLRNEWSEGIVVPLSLLPIDLSNISIGEEVSSLINVKHYEIPTPMILEAKGGLPYRIPKTDESRKEELRNGIPYGEIVDATLKIDGQSCSYYYNIEDKVFGVLGRTLELKEDKENNYTAHIERYDIKNKLISFCEREQVSLVLRGESYGKSIQGMEINPHAKKDKGWAMFSVYNITKGRYAHKGDDYYFLNVAEKLNLPIVDIIEKNVILTVDLINKYSTGIDKIKGEPFEGIVFKFRNGSFKVINKIYDSKK